MLQPVEHDYGTPVIDESSEYEDNKLFRASPVPAYPDVAANGICEHLERMQKSREINRYNSIRSVQPRALSKDISEFTIGQREEERKEREVDNFRILFLIKVEVGKRVYRVKVRENMTVEDVVRNIEKMVGFSE